MTRPSAKRSASAVIPVFDTRMAFIIPINMIRESVSSKITLNLEPKVHFVKHFNVPAQYIRIDKNIGPNCPELVQSEKFLSKPSWRDKEKVSRAVSLSFYLLRYTLKGIDNPEYTLIMLADIGFTSSRHPPCDFITPHDIVSLKKAVIADNGIGHSLIKGIVNDISPEGFAHRNNMEVKGTVINIKAFLINQDSPSPPTRLENELDNLFYRSDSRPISIASFLKTDIDGYMRPHDTACSDMERWVYGLLHTNDNFMMADDSVVKDNLESFYSNNFVERYWASPSTVLTIKTASPFLNTDDNSLPKDDLCDFDPLVETCLLITLGRKINTLLRRHGSMKYSDVEKRKAEIATCFNYTVMNLFELDEKLRFFIRRSNLNERYERVIRIVTPTRNIIEKYHSELLAISSVVITFLSLIVAIISLLSNGVSAVIYLLLRAVINLLLKAAQ